MRKGLQQRYSSAMVLGGQLCVCHGPKALVCCCVDVGVSAAAYLSEQNYKDAMSESCTKHPVALACAASSSSCFVAQKLIDGEPVSVGAL